MDLYNDAASSPSASSQGTPEIRPPTHNPYQRMASRRAIACVTCAKAKTKCDKALPSCSRCITKGIKCDPRSTRRTSENSYRANVRKTYSPPHRYHSTSLSTLNQHTPTRSTPPSSNNGSMRAASHIDFRTAVKMSQQASACSGYPMLTPLPSYTSQNVGKRYSYPITTEQDLSGYTPTLDASSFPGSGCLTPDTPGSIGYQEPLSIVELTEQWISESWSDDALTNVGLGFGEDITSMLPNELWSNPEQQHSATDTQMPWYQSSFTGSPQPMPSETMAHARTMPSLSISECSVNDFNNSGVFHEDWANCQNSTPQFDMADMSTCAPFMQALDTAPNSAPVWEDVFMPGSAPY